MAVRETYALMSRELDNDASILIERVSANVLQVYVTDAIGVVEWARNTESGKDALDMFYHPYAYGYGK